jgi:osmotically-inducible protein OsmY
MTLALFLALGQVAVQAALASDPQEPAAQQQAPAARAAGPEAIVSGAIRANPVTAPYAIAATWKKGAVVLSGRVGTTEIHDVAVRTAIDLGYPVRDELIIDTAEAERVALSQYPQIPAAATPWGPLAGSAPYLVYPPPLFGRVDDPFFGFEPPLVSFPPWWASRSLDPQLLATQAAKPGSPSGTGADRAVGQQAPGSPAQGPIKGKIQLTVDMAGQVFLKGIVASEEDRRIIEDEARNTPGVNSVVSELQVAAPVSESPPPPPEPYVQPGPVPKPVAPVPQIKPERPRPEPPPARAAQPEPVVRKPQSAELAIARDAQRLTRRVADSLARRSGLAGLPIAVQSKGDVVTLSGKVPTAYEAMLAYRTVEQTPGVGDIVDQLQFQVPDENHPNPLPQKGRPDDLEPYLTSQIRRHVGDLAHVDRVRVRGNILEVRGTISNPDDKDRVAAILRSMPLLRDFRLEPSLGSE